MTDIAEGTIALVSNNRKGNAEPNLQEKPAEMFFELLDG